MLNFPDTIISQYSDSPVLTQLIANFNACVDPQYVLQQFYDLIWNLDTAVGYGLDTWGRKVGIGRTLTLQAADYLGFTGPSGASGDSFNAGIFYSGEDTTFNYVMTDDAYRTAIFAKAAANITNGSIPALNAILMDILFPSRGNAFVIDNQNMTMEWKFNFVLQPFEVALVGLLAGFVSPCGVGFTIVHM